MKILYLSEAYFADSDFPLIKSLQEAGHDVTYLIMLYPYSLKSTLFDINEQIQENDIIPASRYAEMRAYEKYIDMSKVFIANRTAKKSSSFQALKMTLKMIRFIQKGKFDVIHTDSMLAMWNLLLYYFFGKKMVLTVHDPFPHTGEMSKLHTFNYKTAMKKVGRVVLLNHQQKDLFCSTYNVNPKQVLINRLGVYDYIHAFVSKDKNVRQHSHNVLFFGRISPYKGIEYLCRAMLKVREQVQDATLTIAGGGKMYFDITPYQTLDWVQVTNRYVGMEELAGLLQDCAITVCPYTDATQSGVIMTSYSLGKPVVASNVGGLGEMIDDGKTGRLVPPKDVDALADAIVTLLKDDDLRANMEQRIKSEYFVGDKSWKKITEKYLEFYEQPV